MCTCARSVQTLLRQPRLMAMLSLACGPPLPQLLDAAMPRAQALVVEGAPQARGPGPLRHCSENDTALCLPSFQSWNVKSLHVNAPHPCPRLCQAVLGLWH
jgi:hypothetical protein